MRKPRAFLNFYKPVKIVLFDGGDEAPPKVPTTMPQSQMYQGFEVVFKNQVFSCFFH